MAVKVNLTFLDKVTLLKLEYNNMRLLMLGIARKQP